ncbi:MAG TPA: hypothetical protein VFW25_12565 [Silvibacterium sp.]|nr:hypothetical protein [Silvibacterium sp.]
MSELATPMAMLPATSPELLAQIAKIEDVLLGHETVELPTQHVIHAGMYARTIVMPAGMVLTGALMKRATLVLVVGSAAVLAGEQWFELDGYNVLPASSGRKQVFVSRSRVVITMVFPTQAKTVEEAETEFTDDAARLLSRRQDANQIHITGE